MSVRTKSGISNLQVKGHMLVQRLATGVSNTSCQMLRSWASMTVPSSVSSSSSSSSAHPPRTRHPRGQLFLHFFQCLGQGNRGGHAQVAHVQAAVELHRRNMSAAMSCASRRREIRSWRPRAGVWRWYAWCDRRWPQAGAGLLHQFVERLHLVIVRRSERTELDFSHLHTVPQQAIRQRPVMLTSRLLASCDDSRWKPNLPRE